MKILKMTATFGALERATLVPGAGLTLIHAPNESGKSTWCAFLRAMLYGFPVRDRDKVGYIAEKTRYQPWSGAPMEGVLELEWQGRSLTLRRGPKGSTPWGSFSAVWTATNDPVEGLTGENCGEALTGVSREVFERTAFVGQGGMLLSPSGDLEKRVSALAGSGEEEVSASQVERRLKDWLNRRRSNARNGLIPKLEEELSQIQAAQARQEGTLAQTQALELEQGRLETEKAQLEAQLALLAGQKQAELARDRADAQAELAAAQEALAGLERRCAALPAAEELQKAQGDLRYAGQLQQDLRQADAALPPLQQAVRQAQQALDSDPVFSGWEPSQAAAQAQRDHDAAVALQKRGATSLSLLGAPVGAVLGVVLSRLARGMDFSVPILVLGALTGWALVALPLWLVGRGKKKRLTDLLAQYGAQTPQELLDAAGRYGETAAAAREAERRLQAARERQEALSAQLTQLREQLTALVRPFAPDAADLPQAQRAIHAALRLGEDRRLAQARVDAARRVLAALPLPADDPPAVPTGALPQGESADLAQHLADVDARLRQVSAQHARLSGELSTLGDPTELAARREELLEELRRRQGEYDAIAAALESLKTADGLLRERFSPALNARMGDYLRALTGGKYHRAGLTRDFRATAGEPESATPRQDLLLSAGTAQQLYLAARLAMCDLALPQADPCPIVLDDALDAFDDHRARLAVECLEELAAHRQILLFSCHSREAAFLTAGTALSL